MESEPFPEPTIRRQPTALPPAGRTRELPRPASPTHGLELPPRREPEQRPETHRTEPGTWREIIARFERELGPVTEEETATEDASSLSADAPEVPAGATAPVDRPGDRIAEPGKVEPVTPTESVQPTEPTQPAESVQPTEPTQPTETVQPAETVQPVEPVQSAEPADATPAEAVQPGEPPFIDEPVPWEIESMTTPDYSPPPSIRDAEHDSWPVDTEDGDAVPAWSDEPDEQPGDDAAAFNEIGELLLDEVVPADPWDREPEPAEATAPRSDFPLDAFIVPAGVRSVSGFDDDDIARRVAIRLDELARGLRDGGLRSLGGTESVDELSRVLAAIVTGYVSRGG